MHDVNMCEEERYVRMSGLPVWMSGLTLWMSGSNAKMRVYLDVRNSVMMPWG